MKNILHKVQIVITQSELSEKGLEQILTGVEQITQTIESAYSYVVYSKYNKIENEAHECVGKSFVGFIVNICVSETEEYNTIDSDTLIHGIEQAIVNELDRQTTTYIVGYGQPTLPVLLQTYDPLICALARQQHVYWQMLEYEDLCQSCRLVLIDLYNKGYYIHKTLLQKSFNNYVLVSLRGERNKPLVVSLDQPMLMGDEHITVSNIIPDIKQELRREKQEEDEAYGQILTQLKEYVVNKIGERQYEQLVFEYNSKTTSNWSRSMLSRLKKAAQKDGLTKYLTERYL